MQGEGALPTNDGLSTLVAGGVDERQRGVRDRLREGEAEARDVGPRIVLDHLVAERHRRRRLDGHPMAYLFFCSHGTNEDGGTIAMRDES